MNQHTKLKRQKLIELSKSVKARMKKGDPAFAECETVNDALRVLYASTTGASEFKTFKGWKEEGQQVNKGEQGFPVWGRPRKFTKEIEGGEDKEYSAFPLATIFHEGQVSPIGASSTRPNQSTDKPSAKTKLAEKLTLLAHSMDKQIIEKMNPAIAQQTPTPRRLRIAEGMRQEGETLSLAREVLLANAAIARDEQVKWLGELDVARSLFECDTKTKAVAYVQNYKDEIKSAMRRAGASTATAQDDSEGEIRRMINELCGCKIDGFFPTPDKIADQMVELAEFPEGLCTLLEPSAGYGALIDAAIRKQGDGRLDITAHEVNTRLWEILRIKFGRNDTNFTLSTERDFIESFGPERYERILMNPPFERGQDMMHVMAAFDRLTAGGILVSIVCENCFYRTDGEYPLFREWLDDLGAEVFELPAGAFTGTIRSTNVKTRIIKIKKPS